MPTFTTFWAAKMKRRHLDMKGTMTPFQIDKLQPKRRGGFTYDGEDMYDVDYKEMARIASSLFLQKKSLFNNPKVRELLWCIFCVMHGRPAAKKPDQKLLANGEFWLAFLRLGHDCNWENAKLHQAVVDSDLAVIPAVAKLASYFFIRCRCRIPGSRGTHLPAEAFEPLEHIQFTVEHRKHWEQILGFGFEAVFKNQVFKTNLAIDMYNAPLAGWFSLALAKLRPEMVCHWLQSQPVEELGLTYKEIMLYVAANYRGLSAVRVLKILEKLSPGICRDFSDRHGNNLLWFTAPCWYLRTEFASPFDDNHQRRDPNTEPGKVDEAWEKLIKENGDAKGSKAGNQELLKYLFKLKISSTQQNKYGFSFLDLDEYGQMFDQRWTTTRLKAKLPDLSEQSFWQHDKKRGNALPVQ